MLITYEISKSFSRFQDLGPCLAHCRMCIVLAVIQCAQCVIKDLPREVKREDAFGKSAGGEKIPRETVFGMLKRE